MKRVAALLLVMPAALSLQGCAAALVPLVAAAAVGKTQVDAAGRTRRAEKALGGKVPEALPEQESVQGIVTVGEEPPSVSAVPSSEELSAESFLNPYTVFVSYALERNAARSAGKTVRGAVLVENVSLTDPKAVPCDNKPMAVIIDADRANDSVMPGGLGEQLGRLRSAGIRVAWISDSDQHAMETALASATQSVALLADSDILLAKRSDGLRKQERRWQLAKDYCVIAVAGDTKSDFDELYDYLRVPEYAIRLEAFWKRGWFELPPPLTAQ